LTKAGQSFSVARITSKCPANRLHLAVEEKRKKRKMLLL